MNEFQKFNLKPFLMQALDQIGFVKPTSVQERVILPIAEGQSVGPIPNRKRENPRVFATDF